MSTLDSPLPKFAMRSRRHGRERAAEARWVRPAVFALLALTALAYLWNVGASGDANSFYAAAVQAGTKSWKAFFFGSLDSSSFITTDKPPASIWLMALSGRIFGFSSWSMLVPQALEGVAAVGLLYAGIRRWYGPAAGLVAGAALALTPVAALMFRFNNPDALLIMLLVASAYCLTRALEHAGTRWIVATGALIGFAFLAKMGQAFLVVPGFGLAYLIAAPTTLRRRIGGALAGLAALVVSGGWWVAIVALLPASSRPFIDGSPDNNIFNLIFGYNGLQRLFGGGGGPAGGGGGGGGGNFSGSTGTLRLFNDLMGAQASWLLPAALVALAGGLWLTRRAPRTDRTRAALIAWGGWLLVTAAVFSYSQGVIHTYYTVALAPAIAALVAIGASLVWQRRDSVRAHAITGAVVIATGVWSYVLLDRASGWQPWLRVVVLAATAVALAALAASARPGPLARRSGLVAIIAALIVAFTGPAAYAVQTLTSTHAGSIPSAGPTVAGTAGGPGGLARGVGRFGGRARGSFNPPVGAGGAPPAGAGAASTGPALFGGPGAGGTANAALGRPSGGPGGGLAGGGFGGGGGGTASVSSALVRALEADEAAYRWVAATSGSSTAAAYELASNGAPVMALGGFNGNGGDLSLARFIAYVRAGEVHYFIASTTSAITTWVEQHFSAETIGGVTVYDLHR
ncbi:MAG TPA: glycosyltransferase family 39 protein [Solirubrobacteraceae bacterium]|jgi:4-amino-4-deoxy-L-arabinose transferase-like glycosyltransferase